MFLLFFFFLTQINNPACWSTSAKQTKKTPHQNGKQYLPKHGSKFTANQILRLCQSGFSPLFSLSHSSTELLISSRFSQPDRRRDISGIVSSCANTKSCTASGMFKSGMKIMGSEYDNDLILSSFHWVLLGISGRLCVCGFFLNVCSQKALGIMSEY